MDTITPLIRPALTPSLIGPKWSKIWVRIPVPEVRVINRERKPIRPRAGMMKSRRTRPLPSSTMFCSSPRRLPISSMMEPWCDSSISITTCSYGSQRTPDFLGHHFRTGHAQFKAFPTHGFDQYRQVQLAPAGHHELVGRVALLYPQRHVMDQLPFQTLLDITAGDEFAILTGERIGRASCRERV